MRYRHRIKMIAALAAINAFIACATGGEYEYPTIVYNEDFADLAAGWTDTADPAQFPSGVVGYAFLLDGGRYQIGNTEDESVYAAVKDAGTVFSAEIPYRLSLSIAFAAETEVASQPIVVFNIHGSGGYDSYDYVILSSQGRYLVGHYDAFSGYYEYYVNDWVTHAAVRIDGAPNRLTIDQENSGIRLSVNGVMMGYYDNGDTVGDGDAVSFRLGAKRDSSDIGTVGSAVVWFDDIEIRR